MTPDAGVARATLPAHLPVHLPPSSAFHLLTPRGERSWVRGWEPAFPSPTDDDAEPGTVFLIGHRPHDASWTVTERHPPERIASAVAIPGERAGRVTIDLVPAADGAEATATYVLTVLSRAAGERLGAFGAGYPGFLHQWEAAIASR